MITLKEKDKELITTSKVVNYEASDKFYLGGKFGEQDDDYVHLLIHDENENFLESYILVSDDYMFDDEDRFQAKTGTILRKLGYDRGRFVLKFVFLRYLGGSPNTVLVQTNGQIYKGAFDKNDPQDMLRVTGGRGVLPDLSVKDDRYLIDEISGTRTEIRIIPQAIVDEEYLKRFSNLRKERARITSKDFGLSGIVFTGPGSIAGDSRKIKFSGTGQSTIPNDILTEGKFFIPQAFITSITPPEPIYSRGDTILANTEIDAELPSDIQASFRFSSLLLGSISNKSGAIENPESFSNPKFKFDAFQTYFKDFNNERQGDPYNAFTGNFANNPTMMKLFERVSNHSSDAIPKQVRRVRVGSEHIVPPIYLRESGDGVIFELQSNSALVRQSDGTNLPTNYTWTISGFDWDKGGSSTSNKGWTPIRPGDKGFGDFVILEPSDLEGFNFDSPEKFATVRTNPFSAKTDDSTNGSSILIKINSWDAYIGIGLTVQQAGTNQGNEKSTVFYPACIVTARND